nr:response regulator transcription factor [Gemmata massiliana]
MLVADPHPVVREGVKALLNAQPDMQVVGEAHDGITALGLVAELRPDVLILETDLPGLDGVQVAGQGHEVHPGCKPLVLTTCEQPGQVQLLFRFGARGYVLKRAPTEQLVQAVRTVAAGGTYLDPEVADYIVASSHNPTETDGTADTLSNRELLVMRLIALGYSNKEIAARLNLSVKTVETYKARAMAKLELSTRADLMRHAIRNGWLSDEPELVLAVATGNRPE